MSGAQGKHQAEKGIRTCICCGKQGNKGGLHRLVRTAEGAVQFDATGRLSGRGAYVCSPECLAQAGKTGKLARALRCTVTADDCARIAGDFEEFLRNA